MFKAALVIAAALLAVSQLAAGAPPRDRPSFFRPEDIENARAFVQERMADLTSSSRFNEWRDRYSVVRDRIASRIGSEDSRRRLLSSGSSVSTATAEAAVKPQSWELIMDAVSGVKTVLDAKKLRVQDFFSDIMGRDWSSFSPRTWLAETFNWDNLADFEITSNLQDVLSLEAIRNFERPQTIGELYTSLESTVDKLCDLPEYLLPEKVPTTCVGPSIRVALVPKTCTLNDKDKQIVCDPAKLVLHKTPAQCTLKHLTAFTWSGKQCRIKGEVGKAAEKVIGGREYSVDLTEDIHDGIDAVLNHVRPDAPFTVTTALVTGQPLQRTVSWIPAEKAALQGVLKYQVICAAATAPSALTTRTLKVAHDARSAVIGAAGAGENAALAAGVTYACSVAAINVKGTGEATTAATFTTPVPCAATALPSPQAAFDVAEIAGPGPLNVWRIDRKAPRVWNSGPLTYQGRADVVQIGVNAADVNKVSSYYNTQGRVLAVDTRIQPGDTYTVTGDLFVPSSWRDGVNPADAATWRRVGIWSALLNPSNYLALNQGYYTMSGFQNVPTASGALPADTFANPQQFARFYDWHPEQGPKTVQAIAVRYNDWNTITSEVNLSPAGVYTFKNYFNGVLADTFTATQGDLAAAGSCAPAGAGCTQLHMYLQVTNPCSGFSSINAAFCDKTAAGGANACCTGATYDAYWSNVHAFAVSGN